MLDHSCQESFLDGRVVLHPGNCLDVLKTLAPNSVDSCVTDPPYHLTSIVKRFGAENAAPAKAGKTGAYKRASAGFMGKQWDGGEIAFEPETWAAVYRVLKPGGHLLAFGAPKNFGFMQYAIAQAGFEVRDTLCWLFGSGFPKSHDVSKGIDKAAGAARGIVGTAIYGDGHVQNSQASMGYGGCNPSVDRRDVTAPATAAAREWEGWGTALKPAYEPIILARKPLIGTVAQNIAQHGTGALNIDGCRVAAPEGITSGGAQGHMPQPEDWGNESRIIRSDPHSLGRWPANVIHDGSDEVVGAFPDRQVNTPASRGASGDGWGMEAQGQISSYDNDGSAARFFYTAKADQDDRLGSKHPTVKPLDLMQWLVRLVTPKGGLVLDPFAGTGTTGEAAFREGMSAILIEREAEYCNDIRRRMAHALSGPEERKRTIAKAKHGNTPITDGLFAARGDQT